MNSGNPRHTYNDKNFREASVKIGVLYGVYSAYPLILIQTVSPQHLHAHSEISEYAFQRISIKTVQNPVIVYVYSLFESHHFSNSTLNTLKFATFSFSYVRTRRLG